MAQAQSQSQSNPEILRLQKEIAEARAELWQTRADVNSRLAQPPQAPMPPYASPFPEPPRMQMPLPPPEYQQQAPPPPPIPSILQSPQEAVNQLPPEKFGYIPMKVAAAEAHKHVKGKVIVSMIGVAVPLLVLLVAVFSTYVAMGVVLVADVALSVFLFRDMREMRRLEGKYQLNQGAAPGMFR